MVKLGVIREISKIWLKKGFKCLINARKKINISAFSRAAKENTLVDSD